MAQDPKLKIIPEVDAAIREIAKLEQKYGKLERKIADTGRSSQAASRKAKRAQSGIGASISRTLGSLRGVVGGIIGVGGVIQAFSLWRQEMVKTATEGVKSIGAIQAAIAGAGDIAAYSEIQRALHEMPGRGAALFGIKERAGVYEAIRGARPLAPRAEIMETLPTALRGGLIFGGYEPTKRFAGVMGELQKIMPGVPTEDIADISTLLTQAAGKHGEQLDKMAFKGVQQLTTLGVDSEEALSLLLASMESAQGARGISSYASYLTQQKEGGQPVMAAPTQTLLAQRKKRDYPSLLREARERDIFETQITQAAQAPDIRARQEFMAAEAQVSLAEYEEREQAIGLQTGRKLAEATMRRGGASAIRRWLNLQLYDVLTGVGVGRERAAGGLAFGKETLAAIEAGKVPPPAAMPAAEGEAMPVRLVGGETLGRSLIGQANVEGDKK